MINHTIILTAVIYLLVVGLVTWILPGHHFQTITCLALYVIAILPNLLSISSLEDLIMAWFDSLFIYIIFSAYVLFLALRWVAPKGLLRPRARANDAGLRVEGLIEGVMQDIRRDIETFDDRP